MSRFHDFSRAWFLTWTTYATWLPGDDRGFVSPKFETEYAEPRNNAVYTPYDQGRPDLKNLAAELVVGKPIYLILRHAEIARDQFERTARHRGWQITIGAIMCNHVHLLIGVLENPDPSNLLRDFKSYGSRVLNERFGKPLSGTWWTEQGSKRRVADARQYAAVVEYIRQQPGALAVWVPECQTS